MVMTAYAAIVLALMPWAASDGPQAAAVRDASITARVETTLVLNPHLGAFDIGVKTKDAVVTLTGSVDDEIQKGLAEDLAAEVEGVSRVVNSLGIRRPGVAVSGERTFKRRVLDRTVTASVRSRLLYNRAFAGVKLRVRTDKGVVTLTGVVPDWNASNRIERLVADTRGVTGVVNVLTIAEDPLSMESGEKRSRTADEWLEKRVEMSILFHRHVSVRRVDVEVDNGVCFLTGTVDSEGQKDLAGKIAGNVRGVHKVRNALVVKVRALYELDVLEPEDAPSSGSGLPPLVSESDIEP